MTGITEPGCLTELQLSSSEPAGKEQETCVAFLILQGFYVRPGGNDYFIHLVQAPEIDGQAHVRPFRQFIPHHGIEADPLLCPDQDFGTVVSVPDLGCRVFIEGNILGQLCIGNGAEVQRVVNGRVFM